MTPHQIVRIPSAEMQDRFVRILKKVGFDESNALQCAEIFTSNSIDGVYTHGVNRFSNFILSVKELKVRPGEVPTLENCFGGLEQWNGNLGPGVLNAVHATNRSMMIAKQNGIGCLALANTNHWMRGGYYGWKAATAGFVFIGWTNTIANLPPWNSKENKLGNNPIVFAVPFKDKAIVLDMAMSQFSFGSLELRSLKNEELPVYGGYDGNGFLTKDPSAILDSKRSLPIGYWKGAGMALLLDLLASILGSGNATYQISKLGSEYSVSQVYISIDLSKLKNPEFISQTVNNIIDDYLTASPESEKMNIIYPGQRVILAREENINRGIPVMAAIWNNILGL